MNIVYNIGNIILLSMSELNDLMVFDTMENYIYSHRFKTIVSFSVF